MCERTAAGEGEAPEEFLGRQDPNAAFLRGGRGQVTRQRLNVRQRSRVSEATQVASTL